MVNNSWKTVTLSQIGTFQKGSGISRAESNSGVLPAVRYGELYTVHNNYVRTYTSHISREVANKALRVHYGDVLFACSGETKEDIAKCAAIIDNSEVYAGGDIIVLSPTTEVDPIFLGFILNTPNVIQQRAQKAQGDAIVHISADSIKSIEITVPEYAEQVIIAEALSDIDTLIVNLEKLIAKKKAIKQGAMQELLTGKRRLPGFNGEWVELEIGKNGHLLRESIDPQTHPNVMFSEYSMPAFDDGQMAVKKYGADMHSNRTVIYGTILLFNKLNVRQKRIWLVNATEDNAVCSSEFLPYYSEAIDLRLLQQLLSTEKVTNDFIGMSTGTSNSQKRITPKNFLEYTIYVPEDIREQAAIAEILADMDKEIDQLQKSLNKYQLVKQGMMSELLTGRIRLIDKEDT